MSGFKLELSRERAKYLTNLRALISPDSFSISCMFFVVTDAPVVVAFCEALRDWSSLDSELVSLAELDPNVSLPPGGEGVGGGVGVAKDEEEVISSAIRENGDSLKPLGDVRHLSKAPV